jgi:hypothetical protein
MHELLDDEYIEVVYAVLEDVDALILDDGVVCQGLVYTPVGGDVL